MHLKVSSQLVQILSIISCSILQIQLYVVKDLQQNVLQVHLSVRMINVLQNNWNRNPYMECLLWVPSLSIASEIVI